MTEVKGREEQYVPPKPSSKKAGPLAKAAAKGTLLEAAFVDPAYTWPPPEGVGKNAIELQAALGFGEDEDASVWTAESMKERMKMPKKPRGYVSYKMCCGSENPLFRHYEKQRSEALQARKDYRAFKKARAKAKTQAYRRENKYNQVPEGILVYRLDTSKRLLRLLSSPHEKTDLDNLVMEMAIAKAAPSPDTSRRGIVLTGEDGMTVTLIACEQRTATAWLEAIQLMSAKKSASQSLNLVSSARVSVTEKLSR